MNRTIYRASEDFVKNIGDTELQHWKYIKKIPSGKGFRYFYSWDEWRAYLADPAANAVKKVGDTAKQQVSNGRQKVESLLNNQNRTNSTVSSAKQKNSSRNTSFRQRMNEIAKRASEKWKAGKEAVKKTVEKGKKWVSNLFEEKPRERNLDDEKRKEKFKYIERIEVNGKYRYFYSQEELDAYNKRAEYQKNEPDYLKKLKHSTDPYTIEEDAMLVNPKWGDSRNTDWYNNCAECSAIYELRRRGYDVESNGVSGEPNSPFLPLQIKETMDMYKYNTEARFERFYENPNVQHVTANPQNDVNIDEDEATYKAIEQEILKNPPGSRGDLSVQWKEGAGGHSMVWEIDTKGNIHIVDTQLSGYGNLVEYDLKELSKQIDNSSTRENEPDKSWTTVTRTDKLTLKKEVTNICKNSKDKKQDVKSDQKLVIPDGVNPTFEKMTEEEITTKYPTLSEKEQKRK